jgi:hypothetical protein
MFVCLGGYLGPGSAYWSPYSYPPLLLPHSLSHYQHYHNQLLLLQQAALVSQSQQTAGSQLQVSWTNQRRSFLLHQKISKHLNATLRHGF